MRSVVLATQNAKKGRELEDLVRGTFTVRTLTDVGLAHLHIEESGETFAANARLKVDAVVAALSAAERARTDVVIGDDSGLIVDALSSGSCSRPGVRSARFALDAGTGQGDADNNALLLLMMQAVPEPMRSARFASAVCAVVVPGAAVFEAFATVEGRVAGDLQGAGGFGYDPLFICETGERMAELSTAAKHAISHRGRAMRELLAKL